MKQQSGTECSVPLCHIYLFPFGGTSKQIINAHIIKIC